MNGFMMLCGHMVGDYIVQRDWMAKNKAIQTFPCLVHCLCYTLAVWAFTFWWMPWWGLVFCFVAHFALDRWRLAAKWMKTRIAGQSEFASPGHPMFPWSIVSVDNTFHLLTLAAIAGVCIFIGRINL